MPKKGWGWIEHHEQAHYFIAGRSLCDRRTFLGPLHDLRDDNFCGACQRKLDQKDEKLLDKRTLIIKTSLPCDSDEEVEERLEDVEDLFSRLEILLDLFFGPDGQYHKEGYSLKLERR